MRTFKQFLTEVMLNFDTVDISSAAKYRGRQQIAAAAAIDQQTFSMVATQFTRATATNILQKYNTFLAEYPSVAKTIDKIKPDGIGPGEFILYFLFDNVGIGGKNAPIDVYLNGEEWAEAKGGDPIDGGNTLTNFKITKDSSKAVTQIMKDLEDFNVTYNEITGEDLPGWRGANELTTNTLRSWVDINLTTLSRETAVGSKKPINMVLKTDGDLFRKGDEDPVINVNKTKSTAAIKKLISDDNEVVVDKSVDTLEKIVRKWASAAYDDYAAGKRFLLFVGSKGTRLPVMKYNGYLSKEMIGLYATHRNQPWAEVYLEPKKSKNAAET
ncbi:MAG: hypothetical protein DDT31_00181 [Syntrophomonadaceae bacterium]|nr:hypothetical protein [Bacillota bacterium]